MFSDHKYECNTLETVSIGGGLSAISIGAKRMQEMIPCSCFDSIHKALLRETGMETGEAGTSQGAKKGWDTKGRGQKDEEPSEGRKFPITSKDMSDDVQRQQRQGDIDLGLGEPDVDQHGYNKSTGQFDIGWNPATSQFDQAGFKGGNPRGSNLQKVSDVYNDLASIIDPNMQGDYSAYSPDIINDVAMKHGITPEQAQEIWDSGGTTDIDLEGGPQLVPDLPQPDDKELHSALGDWESRRKTDKRKKR